MRRQSRANKVFKYLEDLFAFTKAVQKHGDRADIHRVSSQPQEMRRDALKLGEYDSDVFGSLGHLDLKQFFDAFDIAKVVGHRGYIIEPVPVRRDHRIGVCLADLLDASMKEADITIKTDNGLAIELQDHPEHSMGRWVLRTHVENHLFGVEESLLAFCYLLILHIVQIKRRALGKFTRDRLSSIRHLLSSFPVLHIDKACIVIDLPVLNMLVSPFIVAIFNR